MLGTIIFESRLYPSETGMPASSRPPRTPLQGQRQVPRRIVLQGAGVAMSLPWLESLPVWGMMSVTDAEETETGSPIVPQRFAALFMACGVNQDHWWAKGSGPEMELSRSLAPMESLKSK
ncbi:MAG: DUF1552 domain-containing protein [Planctomycetaceae bacterium]